MESMVINGDATHTNKKSDDTHQEAPYKLYWKRWLMLFLFSIYCMGSLIHWIQYSVIADVIVKYYSVSYHAVEWTTMIFSVIYIVFSIPGTFILNKLGLRISILISIIGTCIGSWMKVVAVHPNRFWLVLLSQSVIATFQVFVLPVPLKLAAVWFGAKEVAFACTIGAIALQGALALGFIFPPLLVKLGNQETMERGLYIMNLGCAIGLTIIIFILYFWFDEAPPTPPSFAQQEMKNNQSSYNYKNSLMKIIKNKSFLVFIVISGIHMGASIAIPVLLNQMILEQYPDASDHVGYLGLLLTLAGIVGSMIYGIVISKFGGLKFITWFVYLSATITSFLYIFLIDQGLPLIYFLATLLGAFWSCIYCSGFELTSELTYPEPEVVVVGMLTNSFQLFGVVMTYMYSYVYNDVNKLFGNLMLMVILLLADVLLFFIKFDLKRSEAEQSKANPSLVI